MGRVLGKDPPLVDTQTSTIFTEAPLVEEFGLHSLKNATRPSKEGLDKDQDPIGELTVLN